MPVTKLGPLVLETRRQRQFTSRTFVVVEKFGCDPNGTTIYERLNPPLELKPRIRMRTLQRSELTRLLAALKGMRPAVRNLGELAARLKKALGLIDMTVDLKDRPASWRHGDKCFDVLIGYYRISERVEVIVRAGRQLTLEGEIYPENDIVARFVIDDVAGYQFARKSIYNPRCCPRRSGHSVPRDSEIRAEPVYRLRIESSEWDDMFKHFEPDFRFRPRARFRFRPDEKEEREEKGIRFGIDYKF